MQKYRVINWNKPGEMQLVADGRIAADEEILRERPLVRVPVGDYELGSYAWDLTHKLVADARLRGIYFAWQLRADDIFPINAQDKEREKLLAKRYGIPRTMVRKLYLGIGTNNIGHGPYEGGNKGYGLYENLSRANHSCDPSARLMSTDADTGELILVAIKEHQRDQEITWNYYGDRSDFLAGNFLKRNLLLVHDFGFTCMCSRCRTEMPQDLKGVALLPFFKSLLADYARKQERKTSE